MNSDLQGRHFRSEAYTYALGSSIPVKLDWMAQARHMTAPEVREVHFVFSGTVGAVTGGALGKDAAKLWDSLRFTDEAEVLNASGAMMRIQEQLEYGGAQIDPADVTSGSTNTTYEHRLRWVIAPQRSHRQRDTTIPLEHFLEGGELLIQTPAALPTGWNSVQADWKVRVHAIIADGRNKELKSRMTWREIAMTNQEFDYEINGSLRSAIIASKLTTTAYSSLSSYTTIYSRTLELPPAYQTSQLLDRYRTNAIHTLGSNDEFVASNAIPLLVPNRNQKIGGMIDCKTLHIDMLAATATNQKLLACQIKNRTPNLSALVAGYTSVGDLNHALNNNGRVVDSSPHGTPVNQYHLTLARRLPVRISRVKH